MNRQASAVQTAKNSRPNIVVLLADDQGYGDLGIFGNSYLKTPCLDRLAGEGLCLNQHYTAAPICAPARASLLTGRYNHRTGALSTESHRGLDRIALRERTIADHLKAAGYATGMIGKWHNGLHDLRYHPNQRGFQEFAGFLNGGMWYYDWILDYNGQPRRSDGRYLTDVFTQEAVGFIQRHKSDPFFLYVAYNAPHEPLEAPQEEIRYYLDLERFNKGVSVLYAMLTRMDKGVGRILEALDQNGLSENTIVLFTSDNGPWLGNDRVSQPGRRDGEVFSMRRYNGPFRGMKHDVLEGGIRVPAIIRWPSGLPQGESFQQMVHFCDWLPTLLAAAETNASTNLPMDGINMLPALQGEKGQVPSQRFWQFNRYEPVLNCNAAMRDGKWKLYWPWIPEARKTLQGDHGRYLENLERPHTLMEIDRLGIERAVPQPGKPQLYDIEADPHEKKDLSERYPHRLAKMQLELEQWFDEVNAERRSLAETWKGCSRKEVGLKY